MSEDTVSIKLITDAPIGSIKTQNGKKINPIPPKSHSFLLHPVFATLPKLPPLASAMLTRSQEFPRSGPPYVCHWRLGSRASISVEQGRSMAPTEPAPSETLSWQFASLPAGAGVQIDLNWGIHKALRSKLQSLPVAALLAARPRPLVCSEPLEAPRPRRVPRTTRFLWPRNRP